MEYKETVRAVADKIVADIYRIRAVKAYMIKICDISNGKKKLIATKLRYEQKGYDYQTIKDEIREYFINEAYLISHPLH
jgi:hypothetical protein